MVPNSPTSEDQLGPFYGMWGWASHDLPLSGSALPRRIFAKVKNTGRAVMAPQLCRGPVLGGEKVVEKDGGQSKEIDLKFPSFVLGIDFLSDIAWLAIKKTRKVVASTLYIATMTTPDIAVPENSTGPARCMTSVVMQRGTVTIIYLSRTCIPFFLNYPRYHWPSTSLPFYLGDLSHNYPVLLDTCMFLFFLLLFSYHQECYHDILQAYSMDPWPSLTFFDLSW